MQYGSVRYLWTERDFANLEEYILWVQLAYHASDSQIEYLISCYASTPGITVIVSKVEIELNSGKLVIECHEGQDSVLIKADNSHVNEYSVSITAFCAILEDALSSKMHVSQMEQLMSSPEA